MSVVKTDEGYRVRLPFDPAKSYLVTIDHGRLHCTCSDFQVKRADPNYSCRHIAAVIEFDSEKTEPQGPDDEYDYAETTVEIDDEATDAWYEEQAIERDEAEAAAEATEFCPPSKYGPESITVIPRSRMLIKRSLSPDGRIDSVSVELDFPVDPERTDDIKSKAASALELQTTIIREFLDIGPPPAQPVSQKDNGKGLKPVPPAQGPVFQQALLKDIGSTESKWGRRCFINVEVAGKVIKLFGTEKQLSARIADAGYAVPVSQITEGKILNIPCLVTTKPSSDGRYINVEQVFEADRPKKAS
ncbi:MAG TPA: SWIM zinc finger family protein [Blastocatellia bacterium]|nr:SWIM zinc finger family protein [Blastocatellia bacterium]